MRFFSTFQKAVHVRAFRPVMSLMLEASTDPGYVTLKCLSYFSLPFVHKRVHLDPIFRYFPSGILVRNLPHICIHLKQP